MSLSQLYRVCNEYSKYNYIDADFSNYHIKSVSEFNSRRGGVCWDFMAPMAKAIDDAGYIYHCYFTGLHKDDRMIGTHTYIIVRDGSFRYWIECAWQKNKGVHLVFSYKDVERLLKSEYHADEVYTVAYNPFDVVGMTDNEFFDYLEREGVEL